MNTCYLQSDAEQKPKLLIDEQDMFGMEVTTDYTWKRLLEAENTSELFKDVIREMISHFQILEHEAQLKCNKLIEMENYIHSMRESIFITEIRAGAAEAKVSELIELNTELTEELEFLKGSNSDSKRMSYLENQVTQLEKELQCSKALTESSQEQQKELYMAIWDMETLIEDLKSKAFIAETRSEKVEEQCLVLAETNSELNKQMRFLQSRAESLEASLKEVNREKGSSVKELNNGAKIVADMVMQLALERERIQKKVCSLAKENKVLTSELRRSRKSCLEYTTGKKIENAKEAYASVNGFPTAIVNGFVEKLPETPNTSKPVNDLLEPEVSNASEEVSCQNTMNDPREAETLSKLRKGNPSIRFILMVILVPVLGAMLTALRHFFGI